MLLERVLNKYTLATARTTHQVTRIENQYSLASAEGRLFRATTTTTVNSNALYLSSIDLMQIRVYIISC